MHHIQIVQIRGNLRVRVSLSNITSKGELEFVEPLVIVFIGECCVVETVASILEISCSYSYFTVFRSYDLKKVISVEERYYYVVYIKLESYAILVFAKKKKKWVIITLI